MVKRLSHRLLWISMVGIMVVFGTLLFHFANIGTTFAQNAELSIGPNPASPGATITVTGFKYPANQSVDIYFQSRSNGIVRAMTNASGFFNTSLTLPRKYIEGSSIVYTAYGNTTLKQVLHFAKPSLSHIFINHPSVVPARHPATTLFKGAGFIANERVHLALKQGTQVSSMGTSTTDSQGNFTFSLKHLNIPFDSKIMLSASDSMNQQATLAVHQAAWINISPFAGSIGTEISIKGGGFERSEFVRILFQGYSMGLIRTNRSGGFSTRVYVPSAARISPYYNDVQAYGLSSRVRASASFQILPSILISPNAGFPGQVVQIAGNRFTPNGEVNSIMIDPNKNVSSVGTPLATSRVSSNGMFNIRSMIPGNVSRKRVYTILFVDVATGINVTAYFRVE